MIIRSNRSRNRWKSEEFKGKYGPKFQRWWAWRPVFTDDGEMLWRCWVYRRYFERGALYEWRWEYRKEMDSWVKDVGVAA